jgi:amidohydrolase
LGERSYAHTSDFSAEALFGICYCCKKKMNFSRRARGNPSSTASELSGEIPERGHLRPGFTTSAKLGAVNYIQSIACAVDSEDLLFRPQSDRGIVCCRRADPLLFPRFAIAKGLAAGALRWFNHHFYPEANKMRKFLSVLFIFSLSALNVFAIDMKATIDAETEKVLPQVIEWRRHLHQYPELSNREFKTAEFIEKYLRQLGLEVRTKIAKTGVVGILKGGQPGATIGLRADMDALPVTERVNIPFASKEKGEYNGQPVGVMHACGHDSHVAMLLGTATVLSKLKDKVPGTVVFIFQPAEEGPPASEEGGAPLMVKEGVMDNPKIDAIFGIHINAQTEIGKLTYRSGSFMAASDWFTIKVKGKQTHGSTPWTGVDPIAVASQIITGLQMIVSRQSELTKAPVVITIGRINGGVRENIIPEEMTMSGTIRTLDEQMQKTVHEKIKTTAEKIAESAGATAEVTIDVKTPVTYNTPELVRATLSSLEKAVGKENLVEMNWVTGAEDFAFYRQKAPAFFFNVGGMPAGKNPKDAAPHHTPDFYIDDSRLDVGIKAFCNIVFDYQPLAKTAAYHKR